MTDELTPTEGMNRREMLKRSALVGGAGALMWAAPSVTTLAPAFGQEEGSPIGKGLSYIALTYDCGAGTRNIKFDLNKGSEGLQTEGAGYKCSTGNFSTPGCPDLPPQPASDADCQKFEVWYDIVDEDGEPVKVTIKINSAHANCLISGVAFGKCGNPNNPKSGGECIVLSPVNANSVTFEDCGEPKP